MATEMDEESLEVELLDELLYRLYSELEDSVKDCFLLNPYSYPDEVIDEIINIVDRMATLESKLANIDFRGSFRYPE